MGVVYKAEDIRLGRQVALKFLSERMSTDRIALERFQREARMASALNHPNICTVYEIDEHEDRPFIAMELLEGDSLSDRVARAPLTSEEIIKWGVQILDALEAAHAKNIIHRDIKPQNIFITHEGRAKLTDFGIAKLAPSVTTEAAHQETVTATGLIGTLPYMSSEQLRSERLDNRTDLFSLGSVLYEMITGRLAFPGPSGAAIVDSVINRVPLPPSRLNPDIPAKPAGVSDACYTKEGQKITDMQRCTRMFPVYANPRLNAGQPISDDAEVRAQADRQERLLGSARIRATRQAERGFPLGRIRGSRTS